MCGRALEQEVEAGNFGNTDESSDVHSKMGGPGPREGQ